MTLNAPFKVHTYYIYLLKLSIIPHKLFWPYVIFFLNSKDCFLLYIHNFNTPPPPNTHQLWPVVLKKKLRMWKSLQMAYRRADRERFMDRQSNVCTDRQTDKSYLKNLTWNISSVELKKNCVDVYQCALRHPFFLFSCQRCRQQLHTYEKILCPR